MFENLEEVVARYDDLSHRLADPALIADSQAWRQAAKEAKDLEDLAFRYRDFRRLEAELAEVKELMAGEEPELRELAAAELPVLEARHEALVAEIKRLLIPKDPLDDKNVIIEVRAGTGGEEAALFAADLYRMYTRYAERQGWKSEVLSLNATDIGGIKEIVFVLEGQGAYSRLKFESGVHRVQRVPATEASGRIHTSAATVAVLPEAEEIDVTIDEKELRIDRFCSSGPGGQSVNTTYSAIRITHLPTGLVVSCQDEKSQIKNKAKALKILRSRLLQMEQDKREAELSVTRKAMVGSGDRSEKIRTYNFPQNRVSDHRINLTIHRLTDILDGDMAMLLDPLLETFQAQRLEEEFARVIAG